jgi:hypothetical protein
MKSPPTAAVAAAVPTGSRLVVIIPAARFVGDDMRLEVGDIPPVLLPYAGQTALSHLVEAYDDSAADILVGIDQGRDDVHRFVPDGWGTTLKLVEVDGSGTLGSTVLQLLRIAIDKLGATSVVVNFADTIIVDAARLLREKDAVLCSEAQGLARWTTFSLDAHGRICDVQDKQVTDELRADAAVFVGVFSVRDPVLWRQYLEGDIDSDHAAPGIDPFYSSLLKYWDKSAPEAVWVDQWVDLGHADKYYEAQRGRFNRRHFNTLVLDSRRGTVTKTSRNAEKLNDEIHWYLDLPPDLQVYAPRLLRYRLGPQPFLVQEFYGYPSLADLFVFGKRDLSSWRTSIAGVKCLLEEFSAAAPSIESDGGTVLAARCAEMYLGKTIRRLQETATTSHLLPLWHEPACLDGVWCPTVTEVLETLQAVVETAGLLTEPPTTVLHGDLCLSNILFDVRSGTVRVVDPRGSFGNRSVYGDGRYDIAKLLHSVEGDYDFLVRGLFRISRQGAKYELQTPRTSLHDGVSRILKEVIAELFGADRLAQGEIIEALLFLSMVPLHSESVTRQTALLLKGLSLYGKALRCAAA